MYNALALLQLASATLMFVALLLIIVTLCYMAYNSLKGSKSEITFSDIHKVLSENEASLNRVSQQLNNYQS